MHQECWSVANNLLQEYQAYYRVQENSHIEDKMMFLRSKIVVPTALQPYVINLVHEGHERVEKTKARARQLFYLPRMSTDIEQYVLRRVKTRESFIPHEVPRLPYLKVGIDILEEGGMLSSS
ncbi:hypothetical protein PR048_012621 [Dryococelus australis]|uniref:RNA-directed DNA polymerase n=1 Tax=Dryococelus australis TaxID=614101 RepID=A0ABQ9HPW8_9NEOP|nr:hypothetical protein PR048_012621 [Dryococelus australis]